MQHTHVHTVTLYSVTSYDYSALYSVATQCHYKVYAVLLYRVHTMHTVSHSVAMQCHYNVYTMLLYKVDSVTIQCSVHCITIKCTYT